MELVLTLLMNLLFTAFIYLLVPVIIVFTKKKYSKKILKRIVILNGICGFILFAMLYSLVDSSETPNLVVAFFWSSIAYAILKRTSDIDNEYYLEEDPNRVTECKSCGYRGKYFNSCPKCGKYAKQYVYLNKEDKFDNVDSNMEKTHLNNLTHICLSNADEQPKTYGNLNFYGKDIIIQKVEQRQPIESSQNVPQQQINVFYANNIAKEMSRQCANSLLMINRKCQDAGIDYDDRKLAIATFAYFFVQWSYTTKGLTFARVSEVRTLYKEQFCEFYKVAFQDDSFKSVMENEELYEELLEKFLQYAKIYYDININSFNKEMTRVFICEFAHNQLDVDTLMKYM